MKYKYELISLCGNYKYCSKLKEYLLSKSIPSIIITEESGRLYIEFNSLDDLELLITNIPEEVYDNIGGWKPKEILINFKYKYIYLVDYYLD
jgi:hypothetical protein